MPLMHNVNVFVDVDLTLVDHEGTALPGAAKAMHILHDAGCHLFLWSAGGAEYCRQVADRLGLAELFEAFLPKPDVYIDDMPSTIFNGLVFDVGQERSWIELAERIARDHVHRSERRPAEK
jgi:phosphoglycolate phosphatase-like HAD superfamily hydrolase